MRRTGSKVFDFLLHVGLRFVLVVVGVAFGFFGFVTVGAGMGNVGRVTVFIFEVSGFLGAVGDLLGSGKIHGLTVMAFVAGFAGFVVG